MGLAERCNKELTQGQMCKSRLGGADMHRFTARRRTMKAWEEAEPAGRSAASAANGAHDSAVGRDMEAATMREIVAISLPSSYGTKIDTIAK